MEATKESTGALAVAALAERAESVGERLAHAYNRRGQNVTESMADAVQNVVLACMESGELELEGKELLRRVSAAVKREHRSMQAALGLVADRGVRSDVGKLTAASVAKLTESDAAVIADRFSNGAHTLRCHADGAYGPLSPDERDAVRAERADRTGAVLAAVTLAKLTPRLITGVRLRTGGAGASERTILQSHSAESDFLRGVRESALSGAADASVALYGADGRVGDALASLRCALEWAESVTGESVTACDMLTAFYRPPVYVKKRGTACPVRVAKRRVDLAAVARRVALVTGDAPVGHAVALRRGVTAWAESVRDIAAKRERHALSVRPRPVVPVSPLFAELDAAVPALERPLSAPVAHRLAQRLAMAPAPEDSKGWWDAAKRAKLAAEADAASERFAALVAERSAM